MKSTNTEYGYIEPNIDLLTCDKNKCTLALHTLDKNDTFTTDSDYPALIGKNSGDKTKRGDLKTPVGIYTLTKKINKVESFYGPLAFVTSYPNIYDRYFGRDGFGIWIHGLPEHQKRQPFTKGCIVINNKDLETLSKKIDFNKTLVIINQAKVRTHPSKKKLASILADIYQWRYAWMYGNAPKYLSFYSSDFKRNDGMKLPAFKAYKTKLFQRKGKTSIKFTNIIILPYPGEKDIYEVIMHEDYKAQNYSYSGPKKMIVSLQSGHMQIITEH
jgi:murein L,D-transpeptidase YafK